MAFKYMMLFGYSSNRSGGSPLPPRSAGVSESYYDTNSTPLPGAFDELCALRAQMLPIGTAIIGQRIQRVDPSGPSASNSNLFPGPALLTNAADIPQMALRVSFNGADGFNKITKELRMIPDSQVVEGEFQPSAAFANALANFATKLVTAQWHFRSTDKANPNIPIISVTTSGVVTTVIAHGLTVNDKVIITRGKTSSGRTVKITGRVINVADPLTFTVYPVPTATLTGGYSRKSVIVHPLIASVIKGRITTRKVGRPFDGYRGRASARKK